jgi:hypothetical protein
MINQVNAEKFPVFGLASDRTSAIDRHLGSRVKSVVGWCASLLAGILVISTPHLAFGQDDAPPGDGSGEVSSPGWDLLDPINRVETRMYFSLVWSAEELGVPVPDFTFTNTLPGLMAATILPEIEVFSALYFHRLNLDRQNGSLYTLNDLLADDPEIRAEFRIYVTTGKLAPRVELDPQAFVAHCDMIVDALTSESHYSVQSVEQVGPGVVESTDLRPVIDDTVTAVTEPDPGEVAPTEAEVNCALRWLSLATNFQCMYTSLYHAILTGPVDFDCDDFADALLRYFLSSGRLPGWSGRIGTVHWEENGKAKGHAVPVLVDPQGHFWFIEPKTGKVYGPFLTEELLLKDIEVQCVPRGRVPGFLPTKIHPMLDRNLEGLYGEQAPWWTSDTVRQRFCAQLARCCESTPRIHGCSPGNLIPHPPWPSFDHCHGNNYLPESVRQADVFSPPCRPNAY